MDKHIDQVYQQYFSAIGSSLRPIQLQVIRSVIGGHNTLALMPTGSGKSLTYWVSGMALGGVTLVISPLTALIDEQSQKLRQHGCKVTELHSGIGSAAQQKSLKDLHNQTDLPNFLFVSPERLATDGLLERVLTTIRQHIRLVVIDEAHCISQWGVDFRPFYKEIPHSLGAIFGELPLPTILGLTATLNKTDVQQICADFAIQPAHIIRSDVLIRREIDINIIKVPDENTKDEQFWQLLEEKRGQKILVYLDRINGKRSIDQLSKTALERGFKAASFHGRLDSSKKAQIIEDFRNGTLLNVFATNAFGMGIDIPDIRGVVHYLLPESTEQYYQQVGRCGRDGNPAWAALFYSEKNIDVRRTWYIERTFPSIEAVQQAFSDFCEGKLGYRVIEYFDEPDAAQAAFHYLLRSQAMAYVCKTPIDLNAYTPAKGHALPQLEEYKLASPAGVVGRAAQRLQIPPQQIVQNLFTWQLNGQVVTHNSPRKGLLVHVSQTTIPQTTANSIAADLAARKQHQFAVFDAFIALLRGYRDSASLHGSIEHYLNSDEFERGRVHQTAAGELVRSKSEVIIANMLHQAGIAYVYEQTLVAPDGSQRSPDFTITNNGRTWYWEHLGLLDLEDYQRAWQQKLAWYQQNFPGQLLTSEEGPTLSTDASRCILDTFGINIHPLPAETQG